MDVSDLSTESWFELGQTVDVQQDLSSRSWQDEIVEASKVVEDPIRLFGQFVSAISPDALEDIRPRSQFLAFIRDLCVKAPSVAEYLGQEILNYPDGCEPEIQGSGSHASGTNSKRSSKRRQADRSYQPPKPSRTALDMLRNEVQDSHEASSSSPMLCNDSGTCERDHDDVTVTQSNDSLVIDKFLQEIRKDISDIVVKEVPKDGVRGQSPAHKQPSASLHEATEDNQTIGGPLALNKTDQRKTALSEIEGKISENQATSAPFLLNRTELQESALPDPTPSTPVRQRGRGFPSPLSDDQTATPQTVFTPIVNGEVLSPLTEIDRTASPPDKVEMSLSESIPFSPSRTGQQQSSLCKTGSTKPQQVNREQSLPTEDSPANLPLSPPEDALALPSLIAKSIHIIYEMSKRQEAPTELHSRILTTIRPNPGETPATAAVERPDPIWITSSPTTWSASMWINMLEAGHARSKKMTILNMIEWMGASEWYDMELQQAEKAPPSTKRGIPRKRVATLVLDKYLKEALDATATENLEKLASKSNENHPSSLSSAGIQKRILDTRRKILTKIFHRGRILRKLVQMTHLGILFDPEIWSYAKASKENIDKIAASFQADPQKMDLLSILGEQVEILSKEGRPDPSCFFDSLESHSIVLSEEVSSLRAEYGLERELVPPGCLETAIDRVVREIGQVCGEQSLIDEDAITINGSVEIPNGMFDRLRSQEWLNCWDIAAALEMADRPIYVKLGLSVPLHKEDTNGVITPTLEPLHRWRKKIDEYRYKVNHDLEGPQVYICPLNVNTTHFTLLEINEQMKMIYHYDSMAGDGTFRRNAKSTLVRRVVEEEFKYLGFRYTEVPTPQRKDGWSCGLMVIRNAKRRIMGLSVGSCDSEVDPARVIKEVVGDYQTFLKCGALHPNPLCKKRKKIVEDLRSIIPKPASRSSKRLKR